METMTRDSDLWTVAELCEVFEVSRATLYRWMEQGLPSRSVGGRRVFEYAALDQWLA